MLGAGGGFELGMSALSGQEGSGCMAAAELVERLRALAKEFAGTGIVLFPGAERRDDEYVRLFGGDDPDGGKKWDIEALLDYIADIVEE